jgi:hypothetical protein
MAHFGRILRHGMPYSGDVEQPGFGFTEGMG